MYAVKNYLTISKIVIISFTPEILTMPSEALHVRRAFYHEVFSGACGSAVFFPVEVDRMFLVDRLPVQHGFDGPPGIITGA